MMEIVVDKSFTEFNRYNLCMTNVIKLYLSQYRKLNSLWLIEIDGFSSDIWWRGNWDADGGGQLAGWGKGQVPGGLGLSENQKILPILPSMPHSGCQCPPRPPPMADSAEREHLLWKSQFEGEERGGEVMSRRRREYNSDGRELVLVKFLFF